MRGDLRATCTPWVVNKAAILSFFQNSGLCVVVRVCVVEVRYFSCEYLLAQWDEDSGARGGLGEGKKVFCSCLLRAPSTEHNV